MLTELLVIATLGAQDISDLGYPGAALVYGLGVESRSSSLLVDVSADYSPARKADADRAWSITAGADAWKRLGSPSSTQILLGCGLGYSRTTTPTYVSDAWRVRLGAGAYRETSWGSWRATVDWLAPLGDQHKLRGIELGTRLDYGHLRVGATAGGYQFNEAGWPTQNARTYGGYVGTTW